jgi:sialic acid synthase SpsE
MIILDLGSGNTCQNDFSIVKEMIDGVAENDTGRKEVVLKWQIFQDAPPNLPLDYEVFEFAYDYAKSRGYETTASVFDEESLRFLDTFRVPFIKIAARPELYSLALKTARKVIVSTPPDVTNTPFGDVMACVSKYPADVEEYERKFTRAQLHAGISDHTEGFRLYHQYKPAIYEKHYVLEHNDNNPDAGVFACVPEDLVRIL